MGESIIFILEPDEHRREKLNKRIKALNTHVKTYSNLQDMLVSLTSAPPSIMILSLDLQSEQTISGLDVFLWLKKHYPHITVILMIENEEPALEKLIQWNGGYVLSYAKIKQLSRLLSRIDGYQNELRFAFNEISLFDLVQMVSFSQSRRHIYINDTTNAEEGLICFQQGRIQHAVIGNTTGENALFQLLRAQRGVFSEALDVSEEVYSISADSSALLARSALQQDQHESPPIAVLVIDSEDAIKNLLQRNYAERLNLTCVSAEQILKQPDVSPYKLTILNLDICLEQPELFALLTQKLNLKQSLCVGSPQALSQFDTEIAKISLPFFLFPMQNKEMLAWFQHRLFDPCFEGELINLQLFDALQVLGLSNRPRQLDCYDAFLGECGELWLGNGQILHASFGDKKGLEALESWIRLRVGHIYVQESTFPEEFSIQQPITRLLMNMATILDESALIPKELSLSTGKVLRPSSDLMAKGQL